MFDKILGNLSIKRKILWVYFKMLYQIPLNIMACFDNKNLVIFENWDGKNLLSQRQSLVTISNQEYLPFSMSDKWTVIHLFFSKMANYVPNSVQLNRRNKNKFILKFKYTYSRTFLLFALILLVKIERFTGRGKRVTFDVLGLLKRFGKPDETSRVQ